MKNAKKSDWRTIELPEERATVTLGRQFASSEIRKIRRGLIPEQMEDKWFIYWHGETLFFHRSWTGYCVYAVRFARKGSAWTMVDAEVNRDPEQYRETSNRLDVELISWLIDVLLLGQDVKYPIDDAGDGVQALKMWSLAGRAMHGQHPHKS